MRKGLPPAEDISIYLKCFNALSASLSERAFFSLQATFNWYRR